LGGWLRQAANLFDPLYQSMHSRLLLARVLHSDDTYVKLRVAGAECTSKANLWAYIGEADYPLRAVRLHCRVHCRGRAAGVP
jgi:hypothetical protein